MDKHALVCQDNDKMVEVLLSSSSSDSPQCQFNRLQ